MPVTYLSHEARPALRHTDEMALMSVLASGFGMKSMKSASTSSLGFPSHGVNTGRFTK